MTLEEEPNTAAVIQTSKVTVFKDHVALPTEKMAVLSAKKTDSKENFCYWCHQPGHLQR